MGAGGGEAEVTCNTTHAHSAQIAQDRSASQSGCTRTNATAHMRIWIGRPRLHPYRTAVSERPRANTLNTLNTRQTDSQTAHREEELASDATSNNGCHNATGKTPQRSGQTYSCSTCTSALCRACRPLLCLHTAGPLLAHVLAVGQPTMLASRPPCAANHSARWRGWRW